MATFTNITQAEMEEFLLPQGFVQMTLPGTVELVYGKIIRKETVFSVRIYTGINPDGQSREVGKDAIRVEIWWKDGDGHIYRVGGSKRVHRVEGWRKNLKSRLDTWDEALGPKCGQCGSPMVRHKTKHGRFWGCCTYKFTQCKGRPAKVTSV